VVRDNQAIEEAKLEKNRQTEKQANQKLEATENKMKSSETNGLANA